jgi:hypothetical protein
MIRSAYDQTHSLQAFHPTTEGFAMRRLRIGATNFQNIRLKGDYYADKTKMLYDLVIQEDPYFLSRPRRFEKTLLVSTLEDILLGRKQLFEGLWIHGSDYDWTPYPVIRLDMNLAIGKDADVVFSRLSNMLMNRAYLQDVELKKDFPADMLDRFITMLFKRTGQTVAILIDEYDAPIIEYITEPTIAEEIRETLRVFYGVLKENHTMIGHIFITGVSRFSKTSIFSGLNYLQDITLEPEYATICGFTEKDLDDLLCERQKDPPCERRELLLHALIDKKMLNPGTTLAELRQLIFDWYDGYSWDGKTKVFNPWSLLNFLKSAAFKPFWYQTGTPNLIKQMGSKGQVDFNVIKNLPTMDDSQNVIDDIANFEPSVLMFQTGYLTIKEQLPTHGEEPIFSLIFPNLEVKAAMVPLLFSIKPPEQTLRAYKFAKKFHASILACDKDCLQEAFGDYLALFSYDSDIEVEKFYQRMLEMCMYWVNQAFQPEEHTTHGRIDLHFTGPKGDEYLIELKLHKERNTSSPSKPLAPPEPADLPRLRKAMAKTAAAALNQIDKKYASKFIHGDTRVVCLALVIARRRFVLAEFKVIEP